MSEGQGASMNSDLHQDEDQSEQLLFKYRKEARQVISNLDCQSEASRLVLAKSYRRINKMIDELDKDKFNFSEDMTLLEDVLKSSFFCRAWDLNNPNLKYLSSFCKEAVKGNRRLKTPCIQIEQEIVGVNQKCVRLNSNKQEFTLKIESQPFSSILYTNMPNSHPLLMKPNNTYFLKYGERQVLDVLTPPCEINVVAVSDSKIESKVVSLKITSQINEGELRQNNMGYAIRPAETFPFQESAFGSSESPSFSNAPEYQHEENPND